MHAERRAGWGLVAAGFFSLAISFSIRSTLGIVMPIWQTEMGWQRSFVAGTASLALVIIAALSPVAGTLSDRFGPKYLLMGGLSACGLATFAIALFPHPVVFALAFAGLGALGFSTVATHVVSSAISHAFVERRGLALGIATAGATAGQLLLLPAFGQFVEIFSWRWGFGLFSLLAFAIVMLLPFIMPGRGGHKRKELTGRTWRQDLPGLLKNPIFHLLFWSFFICGFTTTGIIEIHLIPYAIACGIPPLPSTFAYGLLSGINMLGMIGAGYLTDKIEKPLLLGGIYIIRGLSFWLLMNIGASYEALLLFAVLFGLVDYSTVPVTAGLVASRLGLSVMGLVMGLIASGHALGAALGSYLGGYIFDITARYDLLWIIASGLGLIAGIMAILIGSDRHWAKNGTQMAT